MNKVLMTEEQADSLRDALSGVVSGTAKTILEGWLTDNVSVTTGEDEYRSLGGPNFIKILLGHIDNTVKSLADGFVDTPLTVEFSAERASLAIGALSGVGELLTRYFRVAPKVDDSSDDVRPEGTHEPVPTAYLLQWCDGNRHSLTHRLPDTNTLFAERDDIADMTVTPLGIIGPSVTIKRPDNVTRPQK
jgi:hypothetical protein